MPDLTAADRFHAHLDVCAQCERHPFGLCPFGAALMQRAAAEGPAPTEDRKVFKDGDGTWMELLPHELPDWPAAQVRWFGPVPTSKVTHLRGGQVIG